MAKEIRFTLDDNQEKVFDEYACFSEKSSERAKFMVLGFMIQNKDMKEKKDDVVRKGIVNVSAIKELLNKTEFEEISKLLKKTDKFEEISKLLEKK